MNNQSSVQFFSIPVHSIRKEELHFLLRQRIQERVQSSIATLNPEILLLARKNPAFANILSRCTFRLVDGFGISFISFIKKRKILSRCIGRDAVDVCCELAKEFHMTVGVIGGEKGISHAAALALTQVHPDVRFVDLAEGSDVEVDNQGVVSKGSEYIQHVITTQKIGMVFAGFGAQKQESWILKFLASTPSCLCGIGVGGILDVLAGKIKKPPYFFSTLGLEWFWRLIVQPSRFTRILNAVIVFPFKAFFYD